VNEARARVDRIKVTVGPVIDDLYSSWQKRDWISLGYASWDALCDAEFFGIRFTLPKRERQGLVVDLHQKGMSTRAIAPVVGVSKDSVDRDVKAASGSPVSDETGELGGTKTKRTLTPKAGTRGLDGKTYGGDQSDVIARATEHARKFKIGYRALFEKFKSEGLMQHHARAIMKELHPERKPAVSAEGVRKGGVNRHQPKDPDPIEEPSYVRSDILRKVDDAMERFRSHNGVSSLAEDLRHASQDGEVGEKWIADATRKMDELALYAQRLQAVCHDVETRDRVARGFEGRDDYRFSSEERKLHVV
jgi:hypothetical protein